MKPNGGYVCATPLALVKLEILLPRGSLSSGDGPPDLNSRSGGAQGGGSGRVPTPMYAALHLSIATYNK
jgi:hypothetical protein